MGRAPSLTAPNGTLMTGQSTKQQQQHRGRERERERRGRVTLSNNNAARETTETVIPQKILNPAERDQQKHSSLSV